MLNGANTQDHAQTFHTVQFLTKTRAHSARSRAGCSPLKSVKAAMIALNQKATDALKLASAFFVTGCCCRRRDFFCWGFCFLGLRIA